MAAQTSEILSFKARYLMISCECYQTKDNRRLESILDLNIICSCYYPKIKSPKTFPLIQVWQRYLLTMRTAHLMSILKESGEQWDGNGCLDAFPIEDPPLVSVDSHSNYRMRDDYVIQMSF